MAQKLLKTLSVVLCAVLGLAAVVLVVVWVRGRDLPSPRDEDTRLQRAHIPDGENAFFALQEAAGRLRWTDKDDARLKGGPELEAGDPEAVPRLLLQNQQAVEALGRALTLPRFQVPERSRVDEAPYDVVTWHRLGRLLALGSERERKLRHLDAALDQALELLRFGHTLQGGEGDLMTYLVGGALESTALDHIRRIVATDGVTGSTFARLRAPLEASRPSQSAFREMLRLEYAYMAIAVDHPDRLDMKAGPPAAARHRADVERLRSDSLWSRYLYQKNATKKLYADLYREIGDSWSGNCSQVARPGSETAEHELVSTIWEPNLVGRAMFAIGAPSMRRLLTAKCRLQTDISATQLVVSLREYRARHRELPASLQQLVPDHLPSIPLDDFDGRQLRYLPQSAALYSVGENLVDDGGDRDKDVLFPLGS